MAEAAANLVEIAGRYASARRAPPAVLVKEILHYEILHALVNSGAAADLVFQGGTCLRLCYEGNRYSEDLDFAGGAKFDAAKIKDFLDLLRNQVGARYGLSIDVRQQREARAGDRIGVDRWQARIRVPQADRSLTQSQVINIEIAAVPAHEPHLAALRPNYEHLRAPFRNLLLPAESLEEILADKIVALGARSFLKYRDIWDLKFLRDRGVPTRIDLVDQKIVDYGLDPVAFQAALRARAQELTAPDQPAKFHQEMSRFLDAPVAAMLKNATLALPYLRSAMRYAEVAAEQLATPHVAKSSMSRPSL